MDIKSKDLFNGIDLNSSNIKGEVLVFDDSGRLIYKKGENMQIPENYEDFEAKITGSNGEFSYKSNGEKYLIVYATVPGVNIKIANVVPEKVFMKTYYTKLCPIIIIGI